MTVRNMGDLPHVSCIVVDEDTVRYGGDEFRRVRTCRIVWNEGDWTWECDACGGAVGLAEVSYCENCGAEAVKR